MARKSTAGTLEQQRETLRRRGRRAHREKLSDDTLVEVERRMKQESLCFLKAAGFSHAYCADALGVNRSTIGDWLADEKIDLPARIEKIHSKMVDSGVKMMQSYMLEIVEIVMDIIRTTDSEDLASRNAFELLDRLGISKVNKSESVIAETLRREAQVDVLDKTGMLSLTKNAPPDVQAKMAEHAEALIAMAQEHADPEVTDAAA